MADDNFTIPDELLESISGGELDASSRENITAFVQALKSRGTHIKRVYDEFACARESDDYEDILQIINSVYGVQ